MSVTKSQLIATSASIYEHLPNETSLAVLGRQAALSHLTGTLALDVLKINSGPGATVMKALNGVGLDSVITANGMFKSSAFESLHRVQEILGSNQFAAQLAAVNSVRSVFTQDLARLADVSHTITSQFAVLCDSVASAALRSAALSGMRGWENAVTAFVERPDAREFFPLEALGRGTVGVGYAVATLLPERNDIATYSDDDIGLLQPASFTTSLRARLRYLSPRLPQRLDGAWERVSRRGPDAASQAAHSLMETIDWTLRLAAPAPAVLAWHAAEGRPAKELNNGDPTRSLRIEWLLRERPGEAKAARLHLRALDDLVRIIQSYKHSEGEADIDAVARLIPTVEGLLIFVLGISPMSRVGGVM